MAYLDVSMSGDYRSEYAVLAEKSLSIYKQCCTQAKLHLTEYSYYKAVSEVFSEDLPSSLEDACKSYVWYNRFNLKFDIQPTLFLDSTEVFLSSVRPNGIKLAGLEGTLASAWISCDRDLNPDELFPTTGKGWALLEVGSKVKLKSFEQREDREVKSVSEIPGVIRIDSEDIRAKLTMHRYFIRTYYKPIYEHLLAYRKSVTFNLDFKTALRVAYEVFQKDKNKVPEIEFMLKYLGKTSIKAFVFNSMSNVNRQSAELPYFFRKKTKTIELYCKKSTSNKLCIPGIGKFDVVPKNPDLKFSLLKMTREPHIIKISIYGKSRKSLWYSIRPANGNI